MSVWHWIIKQIDYDIAFETVNKLIDDNKSLKHRNENLRLALKTYELPEIQKILIDWRTGELDKKFNKLEKENAQLKKQLAIAIEENKLLKRKLAIAIQTTDVETLKQIKELDK